MFGLFYNPVLLDVAFKRQTKIVMSHVQVYLRAMNEEMDNPCEKNLKAGFNY